MEGKTVAIGGYSSKDALAKQLEKFRKRAGEKKDPNTGVNIDDKPQEGRPPIQSNTTRPSQPAPSQPAPSQPAPSQPAPSQPLQIQSPYAPLQSFQTSQAQTSQTNEPTNFATNEVDEGVNNVLEQREQEYQNLINKVDPTLSAQELENTLVSARQLTKLRATRDESIFQGLPNSELTISISDLESKGLGATPEETANIEAQTLSLLREQLAANATIVNREIGPMQERFMAAMEHNVHRRAGGPGLVTGLMFPQLRNEKGHQHFVKALELVASMANLQNRNNDSDLRYIVKNDKLYKYRLDGEHIPVQDFIGLGQTIAQGLNDYKSLIYGSLAGSIAAARHLQTFTNTPGTPLGKTLSAGFVAAAGYLGAHAGEVAGSGIDNYLVDAEMKKFFGHLQGYQKFVDTVNNPEVLFNQYITDLTDLLVVGAATDSVGTVVIRGIQTLPGYKGPALKPHKEALQLAQQLSELPTDAAGTEALIKEAKKWRETINPDMTKVKEDVISFVKTIFTGKPVNSKSVNNLSDDELALYYLIVSKNPRILPQLIKTLIVAPQDTDTVFKALRDVSTLTKPRSPSKLVSTASKQDAEQFITAAKQAYKKVEDLGQTLSNNNPEITFSMRKFLDISRATLSERIQSLKLPLKLIKMLDNIDDATLGRSFSDLFKLRQLVNAHGTELFDELGFKANLKALIDKEIGSMIRRMSNDKEANKFMKLFKQTNLLYSDMHKFSSSWLVQRLKKGSIKLAGSKAHADTPLSDDDIVNVFIRAITDNNNNIDNSSMYRSVVSKFSKKTQNIIETSVINKIIDFHTHNNIIDFIGVAHKLSEAKFLTSKGQQTRDLINKLAGIYQMNKELAATNIPISFSTDAHNIATSIITKFKQKYVANVWNNFKRLIPIRVPEVKMANLGYRVAKLLEIPLDVKSRKELIKVLKIQDNPTEISNLETFLDEHAKNFTKLKQNVEQRSTGGVFLRGVDTAQSTTGSLGKGIYLDGIHVPRDNPINLDENSLKESLRIPLSRIIDLTDPDSIPEKVWRSGGFSTVQEFIDSFKKEVFPGSREFNMELLSIQTLDSEGNILDLGYYGVRYDKDKFLLFDKSFPLSPNYTFRQIVSEKIASDIKLEQKTADNLAPKVDAELSEAKPEAKPKTETKVETKAETKAGTKTGAKAGTKTGAKAETKAETKAGTKAETKTGTKAGTKAETKTGAKAGTKAGTKTGAKAETKAGTKAETKAGTKAETKAGTKAGTKLKPRPIILPEKQEPKFTQDPKKSSIVSSKQEPKFTQDPKKSSTASSERKPILPATKGTYRYTKQTSEVDSNIPIPEVGRNSELIESLEEQVVSRKVDGEYVISRYKSGILIINNNERMLIIRKGSSIEIDDKKGASQYYVQDLENESNKYGIVSKAFRSQKQALEHAKNMLKNNEFRTTKTTKKYNLNAKEKDLLTENMLKIVSKRLGIPIQLKRTGENAAPDLNSAAYLTRKVYGFSIRGYDNIGKKHVRVVMNKDALEFNELVINDLAEELSHAIFDHQIIKDPILIQTFRDLGKRRMAADSNFKERILASTGGKTTGIIVDIEAGSKLIADFLTDEPSKSGAWLYWNLGQRGRAILAYINAVFSRIKDHFIKYPRGKGFKILDEELLKSLKYVRSRAKDLNKHSKQNVKETPDTFLGRRYSVKNPILRQNPDPSKKQLVEAHKWFDKEIINKLNDPDRKVRYSAIRTIAAKNILTYAQDLIGKFDFIKNLKEAFNFLGEAQFSHVKTPSGHKPAETYNFWGQKSKKHKNILDPDIKLSVASYRASSRTGKTSGHLANDSTYWMVIEENTKTKEALIQNIQIENKKSLIPGLVNRDKNTAKMIFNRVPSELQAVLSFARAERKAGGKIVLPGLQKEILKLLQKGYKIYLPGGHMNDLVQTGQYSPVAPKFSAMKNANLTQSLNERFKNSTMKSINEIQFKDAEELRLELHFPSNGVMSDVKIYKEKGVNIPTFSQSELNFIERALYKKFKAIDHGDLISYFMEQFMAFTTHTGEGILIYPFLYGFPIPRNFNISNVRFLHELKSVIKKIKPNIKKEDFRYILVPEDHRHIQHPLIQAIKQEPVDTGLVQGVNPWHPKETRSKWQRFESYERLIPAMVKQLGLKIKKDQVMITNNLKQTLPVWEIDDKSAAEFLNRDTVELLGKRPPILPKPLRDTRETLYSIGAPIIRQAIEQNKELTKGQVKELFKWVENKIKITEKDPGQGSALKYKSIKSLFEFAENYTTDPGFIRGLSNMIRNRARHIFEFTSNKQYTFNHRSDAEIETIAAFSPFSQQGKQGHQYKRESYWFVIERERNSNRAIINNIQIENKTKDRSYFQDPGNKLKNALHGIQYAAPNDVVLQQLQHHILKLIKEGKEVYLPGGHANDLVQTGVYTPLGKSVFELYKRTYWGPNYPTNRLEIKDTKYEKYVIRRSKSIAETVENPLIVENDSIIITKEKDLPTFDIKHLENLINKIKTFRDMEQFNLPIDIIRVKPTKIALRLFKPWQSLDQRTRQFIYKFLDSIGSKYTGEDFAYKFEKTSILNSFQPLRISINPHDKPPKSSSELSPSKRQEYAAWFQWNAYEYNIPKKLRSFGIKMEPKQVMLTNSYGQAMPFWKIDNKSAKDFAKKNTIELAGRRPIVGSDGIIKAKALLFENTRKDKKLGYVVDSPKDEYAQNIIQHTLHITGFWAAYKDSFNKMIKDKVPLGKLIGQLDKEMAEYQGLKQTDMRRFTPFIETVSKELHKAGYGAIDFGHGVLFKLPEGK